MRPLVIGLALLMAFPAFADVCVDVVTEVDPKLAKTDKSSITFDNPTIKEASKATALAVSINILDPERDRDFCIVHAGLKGPVPVANFDDCVIMYRASDKSFVFPEGFSFRVDRKPPVEVTGIP